MYPAGGDFVQTENCAATPPPPNRPAALSTVSDSELFEYCIANKIGYGYYTEERRRRLMVSTDIEETDQVKGVMDLKLHATELPNICAVVVGPSGCGKTTWAKQRSPKPALFVSHIDDLKCFRPNFHKAIIFDDMDFKHLPTTCQIHLVDQQDPRSIHVRYGTVKLPADLCKIFTCNEFPFVEHEAIRRRIKEINLL